MTNHGDVVVVGGSGFVGSAVLAALRKRGVEARSLTAPRLHDVSCVNARNMIETCTDIVDILSKAFAGADVVVNAAGIANAASSDEDALVAANGVLPGVLAAAAKKAGVGRFIHVSSAAVQGSARMLDASASTQPFSAYSRSKSLGEGLVLEFGPNSSVVFRPAGVHGSARRITQVTAKIARSRFASVSGQGKSCTPQALVENVADAIAFLALTDDNPPRIVSHPAEGLTTRGLLELLGAKQPLSLPPYVTKFIVRALELASPLSPSLAANARRIDMLWHGQELKESWLTGAGWVPPLGTDGWARLSQTLAANAHLGSADKEIRVLVVATVPEQIRVQYPRHFQLYSQLGYRVTVVTSGDSRKFLPPEVDFHPLSLQRGTNPFAMLAAIAELLRILARRRPSLIIYGSPTAALCGAIAGRLISRNRIFVVHGLREETLKGFKRRLMIAMSWLTAELSTMVVFNSRSSRKRATFISKRTAHRTINAPGGFIGVQAAAATLVGPTFRQQARQELGWAAEPKVIGYIGRLASDKGIDDLVAAFLGLRAREFNIKLLLVGGLDAADSLSECTLSTIRRHPDVYWTGQVDDPLPWYGVMDIFCLPSRREGLPTVLLEAASAGVPLVGYASTGIVDVIDNETGWLCRQGDSEGLRGVLQHVLSPEHAVEVARRSLNASELIDSRYSFEKVMEWWSKLYRGMNSGSET